MSLRSLSPKRWVIDRYYPNQPLTVALPGTCIAGQNAIFEAAGYSRVFGGWSDLSETNTPTTLGYTATTATTTDTVTFSGGATALTDMVPYQHILIDRELFLVVKIVSNTSIVVLPRPSSSAAGLAVKLVPNLHPVTRTQPERLSLQAGNAVRYREEAIFAVGRGVLRINASPLSASLTATSSPQVAYPIPGGTYDVRPVGFTRPTAPTVVAVAGGTKGMQAHDYTFRASKKRTGFPGHGLASTPVKVTLAAGQRFQVTFAAFDASEGQTSAYLWVSLNSDSLAGTAWFLLGEYPTVGPHTVEWYDGELGERYVDDNFPPPPALYVKSAGDFLLFCSWGDAPDGSGNPQAPGPGIAVSKHNNPEAFSPVAYTFITPAEEINGVHIGKVGVRTTDAVCYFTSANYLNVGRFTDSAVSPLITIPFGLAGFLHQYSGCVAYDYFYGLAGDNFIRTTDGRNIESDFSLPVWPDLANIDNARAFVAFDPKNSWVVIFQANAVLAAGGKWQTKAWSFNVRTGNWNTPVLLGDGATADFTVCGVATVNERLYFVTTDGKAYEWDRGGTSLSGYVAVGFDDFGGAEFTKLIRRVKLSGLYAGTINLYYDLDYYHLIPGLVAPLVPYPSPSSRTLSNLSLVAKHFPVWKLNRHFHSIAFRVDFSAPANFRLFEGLDLDVALRDGFVQ